MKFTGPIQTLHLKYYILNIFFITLLTGNIYGLQAVEKYNAESPDKNILLSVEIGQNINYSISFNGREIIRKSPVSLELNNGIFAGKGAVVKKIKFTEVSDVIHPFIQRKFSNIPDVYNQFRIDFRNNYALVFRLYNNAVAYRWEIDTEDDYLVVNEEVTFNFSDNFNVWFPEESSFLTHQERKYKYLKLSGITENRFCSTGLLVDLGQGEKMYISESDLISYPGMFVKGSDTDTLTLKGLFPRYPSETRQVSDRTVEVLKYENFLAKCSGKRSFPWRVMALTSSDEQLLTSEIIYKLASPCELEDLTWIKPGKVAWDWWNDNNIYGVDFKAGINTETYKYYIDFASEYKLDYIILDEGWYELDDVLKIKENVDVKEIIRYGRTKNVGVILWVTWKGLDDKLEQALDAYAEWGAKGVKVDFMQRDDQWMVDFYERVAREAAKRKLLVDFHGSYKPAGLRRRYPNVITREGVQGMEHCKWSEDSDPEHNVTIPFIRQVAGPMDYTPGAMLNATKQNFYPVYHRPMSLGTRCHQLGMYVVYESPLQMLADSPSNYYREPECMQFLSRVPTVWDDTRILKAKVGDYVITARKSGDEWFIGGMTDWSPRIFKIELDFLDAGAYKMEIWQDGLNADRFGSDYKHIELPVDKTSQIEIKMAPGGGWAAILSKTEY